MYFSGYFRSIFRTLV